MTDNRIPTRGGLLAEPIRSTTRSDPTLPVTSVPSSSPASLRPSGTPGLSPVDLARSASATLRTIGGSDLPAGLDDVRITGVDLRAQNVLPGDLWAALPGSTVHGASFGREAIENGAAAILTDAAGLALLTAADLPADIPVLVHPDPRAVLGPVSSDIYGRPSERLSVIGVTGTSGKTTTSYLVEAALRAAGHRTALIGTVETRIDGQVFPSAFTTPEAPHLHALFARMVEQGVESVVMEVSSHALALFRADGTVFAAAGFTNLSQDHLDFHHTFEDYFAAKARLFDPVSAVHARTAVVCVDDRWGRRMADLAGGAVTVSTTGDDADWWVRDARVDDAGVQSFAVHGPDGYTATGSVGIPGRFNVANALTALALVDAVGVDRAVALDAIAGVRVPGRLERIDAGQDFLAVVDYAHKPAAIESVLGALRQQGSGRLAIVVGAGGDRDREKRPLMGAASAAVADLVVVTDDNPRSEEPAAIRAAVLAGARSIDGDAEIREIGSRRDAIRAAIDWARSGDIVLVAGKGHETGQKVGDTVYPFDDRTVVAEALELRREHA